VAYADYFDDLGRLDAALRRVEAYVASLGGDSALRSTILGWAEVSQLKRLRQRLADAEVLLDLARSEDDAEALAEVGSEIVVMTRSVTAWGLRTGFAVVEVIPVAVQADGIEIPDEDIRVDYYRTSGPSCNGPMPGLDGVRIMHLPTGIVVAAGRERTQARNRALAMTLLETKLLALRMRAKAPTGAQTAESNQVRSYVLYPHPTVEDPRTGAASDNPIGVLDGDVGMFIAARVRWRRAGESTPR
jgi:hypothetical protein